MTCLGKRATRAEPAHGEDAERGRVLPRNLRDKQGYVFVRADGVRFSEYIRPWMQQRFRDGLRSRARRFDEPWVELTGPVDERVDRLEAEVTRLGLLTAGSMLARSRWT